jgi:hypothetical protein
VKEVLRIGRRYKREDPQYSNQFCDITSHRFAPEQPFPKVALIVRLKTTISVNVGLRN